MRESCLIAWAWERSIGVYFLPLQQPTFRRALFPPFHRVRPPFRFTETSVAAAVKSALFVVWTVLVKNWSNRDTPGVETWWYGDCYPADLKVRLVGFNIPYFRIPTVGLRSRDGNSQGRIPATSRPALGSTQHLGQRVPGFFPGGISARAWSR